tara:strand:- start:493 stop:834 length:342 start_codon:yes stop_codon:yes gene_type:complete
VQVLAPQSFHLGSYQEKYIRFDEIQRGKGLTQRNLRIAKFEFYFQTNKYAKMKYQFFEQIPKFVPEKHWAEDGIHTGAHDATLKAGYSVQSGLPEKHLRKNLKLKFIYRFLCD